MSYSASFMFDHCRLIYNVQGEDGYLFNINTVTGKLAEFCWLKPSTVEFEVNNISDHAVELQRTKPRAVKLKVQPLRKLEYFFNWCTNEPLPCAARAIHTLRSKNDSIRFVTAGPVGVPGGLQVCFRQSPGPVTEWQPFTAGYGGEWLPMKLEHMSRTFNLWQDRILKEALAD